MKSNEKNKKSRHAGLTVLDAATMLTAAPCSCGRCSPSHHGHRGLEPPKTRTPLGHCGHRGRKRRRGAAGEGDVEEKGKGRGEGDKEEKGGRWGRKGIHRGTRLVQGSADQRCGLRAGSMTWTSCQIRVWFRRRTVCYPKADRPPFKKFLTVDGPPMDNAAGYV